MIAELLSQARKKVFFLLHKFTLVDGNSTEILRKFF